MPSLTVNGIQLYYESHGEGPPLLLIHGLGSSSRDWERQVPAFREAGYKVLTVDVRGHGRSDKPPGPYSVPQFASDIAALLEALGVVPAHVVGISMGGMIAFQLAADSPELLQSMVIVNSGAALIPASFPERWALWQRKVLFRLMSMERIGKVIGGRLFPDPDQADIRQTFVSRWAENDKRAYMDATRALIGWSVADQLPQMQTPTLFICADQDYTPLERKSAFADKMPNARLEVIEDARHATPIDQPERFNEMVLGFLAGS